MKSAFKPLLISLLIVSSVYLGTRLIPGDTNLIFNTGRASGIYKMNEIINYITDSYVDSIEKDRLIEEGIDAMLRDLDPHSFYIPKEDYREATESLEGNFEGVGIEFRIISDTVMVMTAIPGGPSFKSGVKAGDRIVRVNDSLIAGTGIRNKDVMKLLKGPELTNVRVGIRRYNADTLMNLIITRDRIPVGSVRSAYMIESNIGYIRIDRFSKTTYQEFKEATDKMLDEGMSSLIMDLRDNPGGLLNQSIQMANEFLDRDRVIVYTEGKARPKKMYYADEWGSLMNVDLAIIINEGSASASEVLAGAIQDNDRGIIIGRRSFGKGLVQEQLDWPDGSALRLTVARYYTPTGRSIQKPYTNLEAYHNEALDRYSNGELDIEDSIPVVDSLKYFTPAGKVVYGGGGIVPDIFIPIDSIIHNSFYQELYRLGGVQTFSFRYADSKR
ncbi:MAG: S41 family peptidase, partial [Vicingaceae bacterium]